MGIRVVKLEFDLSSNHFVTINELRFEGYLVELNEYRVERGKYQGKLQDFIIIDDLDVFLLGTGDDRGKWSMSIKIDGKNLTDDPIEGEVIKGIASHRQNYKLPK